MLGLILTDKELRQRDIEDWQNIGFDKAVHEVHQKFGPEHPVTKRIQEMRKELATYRKHCDFDDRRYIGKMKRLGVYEHSNSKASSNAEGSQPSK